MPIYEYRCEQCGKIFEEIVSLRNTENIICKYCDSEDTKKLISAGISLTAEAEKSPGCRARGGFS